MSALIYVLVAHISMSTPFSEKRVNHLIGSFDNLSECMQHVQHNQNVFNIAATAEKYRQFNIQITTHVDCREKYNTYSVYF